LFVVVERKSVWGKSRRMKDRKRTDFESDEVARVTLSVLNRTEGAADEDSDAGDEEDPEEDAPVVDEFRWGRVEGAGGESREGGAEVREAGAAVGWWESVRDAERKQERETNTR
jgi:hypothetical protein